MKYTVIGLGEFGHAVATSLYQSGHDVIAIDMEMRRIEMIQDSVTLAVCLDASQENALLAQGVDESDALIAAIGTNFEAQLMVVVFAKKMGIDKVVARATTPDHARILEAVGADDVLNPEEEAARNLVQRLIVPSITNYYELIDGFSIIEINAPKRVQGKTLMELALRQKHKINLVAIRRKVQKGKKEVDELDPVPAPDKTIDEGDILTLVGADSNLADFLATIKRA